MRTFIQFLAEQTAVSILDVMQRLGEPKAITDLMQFVLPNGKAIDLDPHDSHASAVRLASKQTGVPMELLDVLQAGIMRTPTRFTYQVGAPITSAQATFH